MKKNTKSSQHAVERSFSSSVIADFWRCRIPSIMKNLITRHNQPLAAWLSLLWKHQEYPGRELYFETELEKYPMIAAGYRETQCPSNRKMVRFFSSTRHFVS